MCRFSDAGSTDLTTRSAGRRPKTAKARLYNPANFEWARIVHRGPWSGKSGGGLNENGGRPSQFAAQGGVFADELMWHRRCDSRPTVDGGTHGPAHGSPSADCARIVREDEVQCPASDRRLCLPGANSQGGGVARFEVVDDEARIVRSIFGWIGLDRLSLRDVCRRLQQMGCKSPRGLRHWSATTLRSILGNPAYIGRAVLGRSRIVAAGPRPCLLRRNSPPVPSATRRVAGPREEWIEIAVPALIELGMFEATQAQLAENRKRKRYSQSGPRWLLQGLTVCRCCGYAYCAMTVPSDRLMRRHHYYRCLSMKDHEFNGVAKCGNPSVRGGRLEQTVWGQVRALLEDPSRVADEYRRRIGQANGKAGPLEQVARLDRQIATVQCGIDRLIDCYAGEFIEKCEFEPRIAGLKLRRSQLQDQQRAAVTAANSERELSLVISRLEDFSAKVTHGR